MADSGAAGLFVVFEGGDGAGKTTQASRLLAWVLGHGVEDVWLTREPGGTPLGERLEPVLRGGHGHHALDPRAEALLFAADRAQHAKRITRRLAEGCVVVCDRYIDSTLAYQGAGRGEDVGWLRFLNDWATRSLVPDLTVLLDVDPETGLARAAQRRRAAGLQDRFEDEDLGFHVRVRRAYASFASADPRRYLTVDAALPMVEVAGLVQARVAALLGRPESGAHT